MQYLHGFGSILVDISKCRETFLAPLIWVSLLSHIHWQGQWVAQANPFAPLKCLSSIIYYQVPNVIYYVGRGSQCKNIRYLLSCGHYHKESKCITKLSISSVAKVDFGPFIRKPISCRCWRSLSSLSRWTSNIDLDGSKDHLVFMRVHCSSYWINYSFTCNTSGAIDAPIGNLQ